MAIERRHARQKLQSLEYVEIGPEGSGDGGFLLDLSEDGAAVQMAHPPPLDEEVHLRFSLGATGTVEARGRLVWRDTAGKTLGICFTGLGDSARARITQWLAENADVPGYEWTVPSPRAAKPVEPSPPSLAVKSGGLRSNVPVAASSKQTASSNHPVHSPAPEPPLAVVPPPPSSPVQVLPEVPDLAATKEPALPIGGEPANHLPDNPPPEPKPEPGEARFIDIVPPPYNIDHPVTQAVRFAPEPTAALVPFLPVITIARPNQHPSPVQSLLASSPPSPSSPANLSKTLVAPIKTDPLAAEARPPSTPYFSLDAAGHSSVPITPRPDPHPINAVAGRLAGNSPHDPAAGNRGQPPRNRPPLQNLIVAGVPALIIVLGLGYWISHPGPLHESSATAPIAASPRSQLSSSPAAAAPPPTTGANGSIPSGATSQPSSSPYDEFSSLYPPPLGPSPVSPSPSSRVSSPIVVQPSSSSAASSPPAIGNSPSAGMRPSRQQLTTDSAPSAIPGPAPSSAPASSPDSQSGDREYSDGMESLQGKGGAPGSSAAATYFWEAVRDGNVPAEVALANLYLRGDGVPKDCEQARALLDAAASLGDPGAPRVIASMPSYGCESSAKQNPRERPPSHP